MIDFSQRILSSTIKDAVGAPAMMAGWVQSVRKMGKILFIDLRDKDGITQLVVNPESAAQATARRIRPEWVIGVRGSVKDRGEAHVNEKIASGTVEMAVDEIEVLNEALTPPFEIDDRKDVSEEIRLQYRYLDLRHERMQKNIRMRHDIVRYMRTFLSDRDFTEIETPTLTKGTPEGAREYVVPSRLYPGNFYVLPQSPQQFKQLLMVAGFERYFQFARCFRDEDQRGDRQPEFTQLDLEMSFIQQDDILALMEELFTSLVETLYPHKHITKKPWPRITYAEAMKQYHTDKPDLRIHPDDPDELAFAFVTDFPLFEKTADGKLASAHHPFTMPAAEDLETFEEHPLTANSQAYDMVLNGNEIGSGSIRIHNRDLQNRIFKTLGLPDDEIEQRFGHMLRAFEYGAPPHGGMAPGIDRIVMLLQNEPNIREVMAFPKTGDARDLMMGAPSEIPEEQIASVHIQTVIDDKEKKT
ncbi:MAG: aspartate--tRNA ligase [Patescibacteria group bacterium]|jgi:aspartyl-tRNA synthetase